MTNAFELSITVREGDIDELDHVNNVVYLRWVQEAATAHWRVLASEDERARLLWVVIRHEIDYKRPAMLGDALVARTWVGEADGLAFERHTEILRAVDRKLLARARTLWCPVDATTMRPVEPGEEVRARFSTQPTTPLKPKTGFHPSTPNKGVPGTPGLNGPPGPNEGGSGAPSTQSSTSVGAKDV